MTTLTLELTDEQAQKWAQEAERLKMTPEQLVAQAMKRIIRENEELDRRLA